MDAGGSFRVLQFWRQKAFMKGVKQQIIAVQRRFQRRRTHNPPWNEVTRDTLNIMGAVAQVSTVSLDSYYLPRGIFFPLKVEKLAFKIKFRKMQAMIGCLISFCSQGCSLWGIRDSNLLFVIIMDMVKFSWPCCVGKLHIFSHYLWTPTLKTFFFSQRWEGKHDHSHYRRRKVSSTS